MKFNAAILVLAAVVISLISAFSSHTGRVQALQPIGVAEADEAVHLPEFVSLMNYSQFLMAMESDGALQSNARIAAEAISAKFSALRDSTPSSDTGFLHAVADDKHDTRVLNGVIADPKPGLPMVTLVSLEPDVAIKVREVSFGPRRVIARPIYEDAWVAPVPQRRAVLPRVAKVDKAPRPQDTDVKTPKSGWIPANSGEATLEGMIVGHLRDAQPPPAALENASAVPSH